MKKQLKTIAVAAALFSAFATAQSEQTQVVSNDVYDTVVTTTDSVTKIKSPNRVVELVQQPQVNTDGIYTEQGGEKEKVLENVCVNNAINENKFNKREFEGCILDNPTTKEFQDVITTIYKSEKIIVKLQLVEGFKNVYLMFLSSR